VQPVGQGRRQHALVGEQASEAVEVELLLDRIDAEGDREQDHADPQDGGRDDRSSRRPPRGCQGDADRDRQQDEDGQCPQLEAPSLDGLERRRRDAAQADDSGFIA
jgi:hypothetical protein